MKRRILGGALGALLLAAGNASMAGPVFLTGHDPDFHAPSSAGARNLLDVGLKFVTGDTHDDGFNPATKFLWVEGRVGDPGPLAGVVPSGHRIGELGLNSLGLALGVDYDRANGSELAGVDFGDYTAIVIASAFGGLLTRAELDALIARDGDIADFINAGGGLMALAECDADFASPCGANLLGDDPDLFGYLPVGVVSVPPDPPFTVTTFGSDTLGLANSDVNDPTHNSFAEIGGLMVVDTDESGIATTLAGTVRVDDGGFTPVPEPGTMLLLGAGLLGLGLRGRRRSG